MHVVVEFIISYSAREIIFVIGERRVRSVVKRKSTF